MNEYERGTDTKQLDEFFSELRRCIVPLIQKISDCEPVDDSFLYRPCPIEQQRRLSDYIMEVYPAYCRPIYLKNPSKKQQTGTVYNGGAGFVC